MAISIPTAIVEKIPEDPLQSNGSAQEVTLALVLLDSLLDTQSIAFPSNRTHFLKPLSRGDNEGFFLLAALNPSQKITQDRFHFLNIRLMLLFGWQGATCIDEWTMAASNFAMGITLFLVGGGAYSIDNWLLKKNSSLAGKGWFRWLGGSLPLPLAAGAFKKLALTLFWIGVIFIVATYSYYRGSVVTPFHGDPTGVKAHHIAMKDLQVASDGSVTVHMYVNAGTASVPAHIIAIRLLAVNGKTVEAWSGKELSKLPATDFANDYAYQRFTADPVLGIKAGLGAVATVHLPASSSGFIARSHGPYQLQVLDINGQKMTVASTSEP